MWWVRGRGSAIFNGKAQISVESSPSSFIYIFLLFVFPVWASYPLPLHPAACAELIMNGFGSFWENPQLIIADLLVTQPLGVQRNHHKYCTVCHSNNHSFTVIFQFSFSFIYVNCPCRELQQTPWSMHTKPTEEPPQQARRKQPA